MNIPNGIVPRRFWLPLWGWVRYTDHRDKALHRTFGATTTPLPLMEYNYDTGFGMPDQNADGYPNGCTGYAQSNIAQDADKLPYRPVYTYEKTLEMSGLPANSPCDIRVSMKSTIVYGVQQPSETTDDEAETHRQGAYFNVDQIPGMDWFDSIRLALRNNPGRSISMGTPWFPEFERPDANGVVPTVFTGDPDSVPWHNHKVSGETAVEGLPYLLDASWQGQNIGDRGWLKFGREPVNAVMAISGTEAFLRRPAGDMTVQTIELTLWETILSYIGLYLSKLQALRS